MNKQDKLWKAIIEEFFLDFLLYFYPDFVPKIDLSKGFDFLDKDLPKFLPEAAEIDRKADKVVKINLKDGSTQWIIIHIEVQGYKDPNFPHRMFVYYYRLAERFGVPIATLVIYSDDNQQNRANKYEAACLNTKLSYEFDTFAISDYTDVEYDKMETPIATVFQAALMGLQRNLKDEALFDMKTQLFRKMLDKGYPKQQIKLLTSFIKEYVSFGKPEFNRKFDEQVDYYSQNRKHMGLLEKGLEQGFEKGFKLQSIIKDFEVRLELIQNSLKLGLSTDTIAKISNLEEAIIKELQLFFQLSLHTPLKKDLAGIRTKIMRNFPQYGKTQLETDLIRFLLAYQFSEKSVSKLLKIPLKKVKKTKASSKKK